MVRRPEVLGLEPWHLGSERPYDLQLRTIRNVTVPLDVTSRARWCALEEARFHNAQECGPVTRTSRRMTPTGESRSCFARGQDGRPHRGSAFRRL
jgi:hypothetical protein